MISVFVDETNGHLRRLLGFSVYVSNTTDKEDGSICFYDNEFYTPSTIPEIPTINCTMPGIYVIFYNERKQGQPSYYDPDAFIELCEFEVYGKHSFFINYSLYALLQRALKIMRLYLDQYLTNYEKNISTLVLTINNALLYKAK